MFLAIGIKFDFGEEESDDEICGKRLVDIYMSVREFFGQTRIDLKVPSPCQQSLLAPVVTVAICGRCSRPWRVYMWWD